jgi:hypothetical protein
MAMSILICEGVMVVASYVFDMKYLRKAKLSGFRS